MTLLAIALLFVIEMNDLASGLVYVRGTNNSRRSNSWSTPAILFGTVTDVEVHGLSAADRTFIGDPATAARAAEAHQFRLDLDNACLSPCHGILHASGCRRLSDLGRLAPSQVTSMGLDDSHSSIIGRIRDSNSGNKNCRSSGLELSAAHDGIPFTTDETFTFEAVCAKNDIYKGALFTPDQCNQLKRMSEHHAYRTNPSWRGMPCVSVPFYTSTIDGHFQLLFREMYSLFQGRMRAGTIEFESTNEPHLVKYNGKTMTGAPLHTDNPHKSMTVNVLLSDNADFEGGGTYIKAIDRTIKLNQGEVLIHPGNLEHAGADITFGVRHLLVAFLECEWEDAELAKEPVSL